MKEGYTRVITVVPDTRSTLGISFQKGIDVPQEHFTSFWEMVEEFVREANLGGNCRAVTVLNVDKKVLASYKHMGAGDIDPNQEFPSARHLSSQLGLHDRAASNALSDARKEGKKEAELRGVTYCFRKDMVGEPDIGIE